MVFSLLTYNVLYNNAFNEIKPLVEKYKPDFICLQEIDTDEPNLMKLEKLHYNLADYSNSFIKFGRIYGVATFYNPEKLKLTKSTTFELPRSIYELVLVIVRLLRGGNKPRTVLKTDFRTKEGKRITIFNTHLAVFETNGARVKQMKKILEFVQKNKKLPLIIAGDFNYYPYRRKQLETIMKKSDLAEATDSIPYTMQPSNDGKKEKYNLVQRIGAKIASKFYNNGFKLDYIFYRNLVHKNTQKVDVRFSDHFPIIFQFEI